MPTSSSKTLPRIMAIIEIKIKCSLLYASPSPFSKKQICLAISIRILNLVPMLLILKCTL